MTGDKTMKTIRIYNYVYEIISSWDKTMKTIRIYNYLYDIISALARASAWVQISFSGTKNDILLG